MSSSNQIIQQSGEDIECSYNTELFIADSSAEHNNWGLIYIMRMKSSPLSRNITLVWHGCLYFSSLSNKVVPHPAQKRYQSDAHFRQWKVYGQCIALNIMCDPGRENITKQVLHQYSLCYVTWVVRKPCREDELPKSNYKHSTTSTTGPLKRRGCVYSWARLCLVLLLLQAAVLERPTST